LLMNAVRVASKSYGKLQLSFQHRARSGKVSQKKKQLTKGGELEKL
jgi:hypothetical protein